MEENPADLTRYIPPAKSTERTEAEKAPASHCRRCLGHPMDEGTRLQRSVGSPSL